MAEAFNETASQISSQDSGVTHTSHSMPMVDAEDEDTLTLTYLVEKTPREGLGIALQGSPDGYRGYVET